MDRVGCVDQRRTKHLESGHSFTSRQPALLLITKAWEARSASEGRRPNKVPRRALSPMRGAPPAPTTLDVTIHSVAEAGCARLKRPAAARRPYGCAWHS